MLPIILTIADDEDRAFVEKIYTQYEERLYTIAKVYLHDDCDAEDCVHDTVEIIIKSLDRFKLARDKGYLDRLIPVVCRNCAMNYMRVKHRKQEYEQSFVRYNLEKEEYEDIEIPDYNASVDKICISEENCEYLKELINSLEPKYRDIVLLKSMGFDYKGISEVLNVPEELIRKRYSRAKRQLWRMGGKRLYV